MLEQGVIEPSDSAWSLPIVVVRKKDGKHRFCIDFRRVNEVTHRDAYPLPQVTATLDKLRGALFIDARPQEWVLASTAYARKPADYRFHVTRGGSSTLRSCHSGYTRRSPLSNDC